MTGRVVQPGIDANLQNHEERIRRLERAAFDPPPQAVSAVVECQPTTVPTDTATVIPFALFRRTDPAVFTTSPTPVLPSTPAAGDIWFWGLDGGGPGVFVLTLVAGWDTPFASPAYVTLNAFGITVAQYVGGEYPGSVVPSTVPPSFPTRSAGANHLTTFVFDADPSVPLNDPFHTNVLAVQESGVDQILAGAWLSAAFHPSEPIAAVYP